MGEISNYAKFPNTNLINQCVIHNSKWQKKIWLINSKSPQNKQEFKLEKRWYILTLFMDFGNFKVSLCSNSRQAKIMEEWFLSKTFFFFENRGSFFFGIIEFFIKQQNFLREYTTVSNLLCLVKSFSHFFFF